MTITEAQSQQLATIYESAAWKTFRKVLLEDRQLEIAQLSLTVPSWDQVNENRGRVVELRHLEVEMAKNHKKVENRERRPNGKGRSVT
jgi:hypothetical protein